MQEARTRGRTKLPGCLWARLGINAISDVSPGTRMNAPKEVKALSLAPYAVPCHDCLGHNGTTYHCPDPRTLPGVGLTLLLYPPNLAPIVCIVETGWTSREQEVKNHNLRVTTSLYAMVTVSIFVQLPNCVMIAQLVR